MRRYHVACAVVLLAVGRVPAQNPATPTPTPERLDILLKAWEQRMTGIENLTTKCNRTTVDAVTKRSTVYIGEAAFMKPNMARIDLTVQDEVGRKDAEKTNFERIFCNGQYIYEYSPRDKKIIIHDIPKDAAMDNMILSFLKGIKADDAKKRFGLTLTKETEWYAYIYITPKSDADKQDFTAAQLTVWVKNPNPQGQPNLTMMPCRLWYRQPNGREITYMFSEMQPNGKIERDAFVPRSIPGYETIRAGQVAPPPPKDKAPTIRPQNP